MLVNIEVQDISALSQQFGKLVSALLEIVKMPAMPLEVDATDAGNFRGFDGGQFYVVQGGTITARYQGKTIYTAIRRWSLCSGSLTNLRRSGCGRGY